jgi:hypothetical protein
MGVLKIEVTTSAPCQVTVLGPPTEMVSILPAPGPCPSPSPAVPVLIARAYMVIDRGRIKRGMGAFGGALGERAQGRPGRARAHPRRSPSLHVDGVEAMGGFRADRKRA